MYSAAENGSSKRENCITVSEVFAEAIKRVYDGKSVSALFEF